MIYNKLMDKIHASGIAAEFHSSELLAKAEVFNVDEDSLEWLSSGEATKLIPTLMKVNPALFRLPFPVVWFEFHYRDKGSFAILAYELGDVTAMFAIKKVSQGIKGIKGLASRNPDESDFKWHDEYAYKEYWGSTPCMHLAVIDGEMYCGEAKDQAAESPTTILLEDGDTSMFASVMATTLVMTNSPTLCDMEPSGDYTKLNKRRAKKGKRPLVSHTVVKLKFTGHHAKQRQSSSGDGTGTRHRYHSVRRHIRIVRGMPRWVRAHFRGDLSLGAVDKTYEVEA